MRMRMTVLDQVQWMSRHLLAQLSIQCSSELLPQDHLQELPTHWSTQWKLRRCPRHHHQSPFEPIEEVLSMNPQLQYAHHSWRPPIHRTLFFTLNSSAYRSVETSQLQQLCDCSRPPKFYTQLPLNEHVKYLSFRTRRDL